MPLSINEAVKAGITRLRLDNWANKDDHIKIVITKHPETGEPYLGAWWELWSPVNEMINGVNPVKNMVIGAMGLGDLDAACWSVYNPITPPPTGMTWRDGFKRWRAWGAREDTTISADHARLVTKFYDALARHRGSLDDAMPTELADQMKGLA